jgi:hypothetical protein
MRVAVICEFSGTVRDAFIRRGVEAVSFDILPSESDFGPHVQGDVRKQNLSSFDTFICHPTCTYLCNSGVWALWDKKTKARNEERWQAMREARSFFIWCLTLPGRVCVENPVPHGHAKLPPYAQTIQPYEFGHDASKRTCLWLKGIPKLVQTKFVEPTFVCPCGHRFAYLLGKYGCYNCDPKTPARSVYANQTPSGQNKLGPSDDRWRERSKTYQGIADAMAEQWSKAI